MKLKDSFGCGVAWRTWSVQHGASVILSVLNHMMSPSLGRYERLKNIDYMKIMLGIVHYLGYIYVYIKFPWMDLGPLSDVNGEMIIIIWKSQSRSPISVLSNVPNRVESFPLSHPVLQYTKQSTYRLRRQIFEGWKVLPSFSRENYTTVILGWNEKTHQLILNFLENSVSVMF
jgi:hypothetical protein